MRDHSLCKSSISVSYWSTGKFVRALVPSLFMAARSKARAASSSVSWSPSDVVFPLALICRAAITHQTPHHNWWT